MPHLAPGLAKHGSAASAHDLKGWPCDFLGSEGRKSMNLALRFDYRQRYVAEIVYVPIWGGDCNNQVDKDQLALALGMRL